MLPLTVLIAELFRTNQKPTFGASFYNGGLSEANLTLCCNVQNPRTSETQSEQQKRGLATSIFQNGGPGETRTLTHRCARS